MKKYKAEYLIGDQVTGWVRRFRGGDLYALHQKGVQRALATLSNLICAKGIGNWPPHPVRNQIKARYQKIKP